MLKKKIYVLVTNWLQVIYLYTLLKMKKLSQQLTIEQLLQGVILVIILLVAALNYLVK